MSADQVFEASANRTVNLLGSELAFKAIKYAIPIVGKEMILELHQDDRPGLLFPIHLDDDRGNHLGAILVLADRAILAWGARKGLKYKTFVDVIPLDSITDMDVYTVPESGFTATKHFITIHSGEIYCLSMLDLPRCPGLLVHLLDGSFKPVTDEDVVSEHLLEDIGFEAVDARELSGALIIGVAADSLGYMAGIDVGDVIFRVGEDSVETCAELEAQLTNLPAGTSISVGFEREGEDFETILSLEGVNH